jgi:hypothetical protein
VQGEELWIDQASEQGLKLIRPTLPDALIACAWGFQSAMNGFLQSWSVESSGLTEQVLSLWKVLRSSTGRNSGNVDALRVASATGHDDPGRRQTVSASANTVGAQGGGNEGAGGAGGGAGGHVHRARCGKHAVGVFKGGAGAQEGAEEGVQGNDERYERDGER